MFAEAHFEFLESAVETREPCRKLARGSPFIGVHVPAIESEGRDARAIGFGEQPRRAARRLPHSIRLIHPAARFRHVAGEAAARRHLPGFEADAQSRGESRIAVLIEIENTHGEIVARGGQNLRRPTEHWRWAAYDERRRGADAKAALTRGFRRRQGKDRAIEPAGLGVARSGIAALQNILPSKCDRSR
jgi:hypothetical protein